MLQHSVVAGVGDVHLISAALASDPASASHISTSGSGGGKPPAQAGARRVHGASVPATSLGVPGDGHRVLHQHGGTAVMMMEEGGGATSNLQSGRGHQHFNSLCLEIWYRTTKDCHGPRSPHTTVQNCRCSDHKAEKKNQWHYNNQKYLNTSIILSFSSYLWIDV